MDATSLLFDSAHAFLGEVTSRDGGMTRVILTAEGEQSVGPHLSDWQVRGIPHVQEVQGRHTSDGSPVFYQERIQVRNSHFLETFRRWLSGHGIALVTVSPDVMAYWENILSLPLEPRERFAMVVTIRDASGNELEEWKTTLHAAHRAVEDEQRSTHEAILALRDHAARKLVARFKQKTT